LSYARFRYDCHTVLTFLPGSGYATQIRGLLCRETSVIFISSEQGVEQRWPDSRLARYRRGDDTPVARYIVAARLFRTFESNRIGLRTCDRKKRIRFEFNSEPHSPQSFWL
jgi:hypothetical protein